jgi:dTDP-4-dehydrorhamnose reductase
MEEKDRRIKVLITGGDGQLGQWLVKILELENDILLKITDIDSIDIVDRTHVLSVVESFNPDFVINAAAYTAVDLAESNQHQAFQVNAEGPGNLAFACKKYHASLIHISTDYVYHSVEEGILNEQAPTLPKSIYARSKYDGEVKIQELMDNFYIIRTSWLYSEFGSNFVKTILRLSKEGKPLTIVNDQHGSPTYCRDLADTIKNIILKEAGLSKHQRHSGVYNYSNLGETNWYEFAKAIVKIAQLNVDISPIPSTEYRTAAPRPKNSRLDKEKIMNTFGIAIPDWKVSLEDCLQNM